MVERRAMKRREPTGNTGARRADKETTGGRTVVVCCKSPNGIILDLFDWTEQRTASPGGFVTEKIARRRTDRRFIINGNRVPFGKNPEYSIIGENGYALTRDIPKDFWEEWLRQNKDNDLVRNKIIFALDTEGSAIAKAKEHAKVRTGLEPLDPNKLPDRKIATDTDLARKMNVNDEPVPITRGSPS